MSNELQSNSIVSSKSTPHILARSNGIHISLICFHFFFCVCVWIFSFRIIRYLKHRRPIDLDSIFFVVVLCVCDNKYVDYKSANGNCYSDCAIVVAAAATVISIIAITTKTSTIHKSKCQNRSGRQAGQFKRQTRCQLAIGAVLHSSQYTWLVRDHGALYKCLPNNCDIYSVFIIHWNYRCDMRCTSIVRTSNV